MYALLLKSGAELNLRAATRILAVARGVAAPDVMKQLKDRPGILDEALTEDQALAATAAFPEAGMPVFAMPASDLVMLGQTIWARTAEMRTDGLHVEGFEGGPDSTQRKRADVPWPCIALIAAARVRREEVVTRTTTRLEVKSIGGGAMRGGGVHVGLVPDKEKVTRGAWSFLLDVLSADPPLHVRFDAARFNFATSGLPLAQTSFENFCRLAIVVAKRTPAARVDQGVRLVLDGNPLTRLDVPSLAAYDNLLRWKLELARLE